MEQHTCSAMKAHHLRHSMILSLLLLLLPLSGQSLNAENNRRILHQPLFPATSSPPPESASPPPPSLWSAFGTPDQPFFPEAQNQPPPPPTQSTNGALPIPTATQPSKPTKKVAIAISVGIVTLGMLSAFAFFLYRHRLKHPTESQKLVGANSERFNEDLRAPSSNFLYIGTMEPSTRVNGCNGSNNSSPYRKLDSVKRSDLYRPSPELHPLPPLVQNHNHLRNSPPPPTVSSSDEESQETTTFYTPQGSIGTDEGSHTYTPQSKQSSIPHSKRTSPKSRLSASSPPPAPPPPQGQAGADQCQKPTNLYLPSRVKFSSPPPPPNLGVLSSVKNLPPRNSNTAPPPPPPPPPLPPMLGTPGKVGFSVKSVPLVSSQVKLQSEIRNSKNTQENEFELDESPKPDKGLERTDSGENEEGKPRLKPLHWDKVRATSDRATVWDQLKSSSFQLNEDMMESLFGCNSTKSVQKEPTRRTILPHPEQENRVLDPKKSQNIAILLRALNVTRDEVTEALLDGNPEGLGPELLETLVKMAPTKQEEIKLIDYSGEITKLGSAERFLKAVLDIPFAFKRVEAMLYRANFDTEVKYLRKAFQTLEAASEELKNSRLFLKLLEAVLRTGNRMNVGTNRGDAKSFKLDTLLKLVDVKGTDGKTTLLHFVVQEIIRSEGTNSDTTTEITQNKIHPKSKEDDFRKQGLEIVSGLSRELSNVRKAAGMDSDVLSSYVTKLEVGLQKVRLVLQYEKPNMQGKFFESIKSFLREAEEEIVRIKGDERKALLLVKGVTEYFHGDAAKEEAHPLRIFMVVRDFLCILDNVCKEVGKMQEKTMVGTARSFRIPASASLPVLNRLNMRQDGSYSDEESLSP